VRRRRVGTPSLITAVPLHPGAYLPSAVISPWLAAGQDAWRRRCSISAASWCPRPVSSGWTGLPAAI